MTDTIEEHADPTLHKGDALVEMQDVGKAFGPIVALEGINLTVRAGEVACVLGDNGAGKSTLIKIISGLHPHTSGTLKVDGQDVKFGSPRDSLDHGIATVYQDLAVVGLMEVWRNFFLGSELRKGNYPLAPLDIAGMRRIADEELKKMGISVKDINQPIGTLSGGQRQCVAIARAVYFGARVLILDEPTAALGVKQSGVVLKYTARARDAGLGVVFITHNPVPRVPRRQPLHHPQTRPPRAGQNPRRSHPRGADHRNGRRPRTRRTVPRTEDLSPAGLLKNYDRASKSPPSAAHRVDDVVDPRTAPATRGKGPPLGVSSPSCAWSPHPSCFARLGTTQWNARPGSSRDASVPVAFKPAIPGPLQRGLPAGRGGHCNRHDYPAALINRPVHWQRSG
jgi:simple sugar transport system ATP-binding protein